MANIDLRITQKGIQDKAGLSLFTIVKNEEYFLPHFFEHYQRLGVKNFLVYNDNSTDGTCDFLSCQPNCTVISSQSQFADVFGRCKITGAPKKLCEVLKEWVPETMLPGQWVVSVDADEFMVLPPGFDSLPQFIETLEKQQQFYATAPMVDFYPETLNHQNYDYHLSPFAGCPYFDAGPLFTWQPDSLFPRQYMKGVRYRLLKMIADKDPALLKSIYGSHPVSLAKTWKVPLLKHGAGIGRVGHHEITVPPANRNNVALAHFKFYPHAERKIAEALESRQYYNASMEYRFMKAAIDLFGDESMLAEETRKYDGPFSLVNAQLINV